MGRDNRFPPENKYVCGMEGKNKTTKLKRACSASVKSKGESTIAVIPVFNAFLEFGASKIVDKTIGGGGSG